MADAVAEYRKRRQQRLDARFHRDAPEEEANGNNNTPVKRTGGHGNTRLPFGLCQRYGIDVDSSWSPRDAWDALAEKGITPEAEFAKRNGGASFIRTRSGATYKNLSATKVNDGKYTLRGDFTDRTLSGRPITATSAAFHTFLNKEEMYACLQEHGISRFKDPDTGETVNPSKMKLPKTVAKVIKTRAAFEKALAKRGWDVIKSEANFVFAKPPTGDAAKDIFSHLKDRNIFVRYFPGPRTGDRLRISVGTDADMDTLLAVLADLDSPLP